MNIELQRQLLGDPYRNKQLYQAIRRITRPGDVVLDLGAGTGILGFWALKFGAARAIFVDESPVLEFAIRIAKKLGLERQCDFHQTHSSNLKLEKNVDIILCEILGSYPFEEHMLETLQDTVKFLKPKGKILPAEIKLTLTPVISQTQHKKIDVWPQIGYGLPFDDIRSVALSRMYSEPIAKSACMKPARELIHMNFESTIQSAWSVSTHWTFTHTAKIYGFCLYWEATLVPGVVMGTSPWKTPTHWKQIYLPLLDPLHVKKGYTLDFHLASDTHHESGVHVSWSGTLKDITEKQLATFAQDTNTGAVGDY